MTLLRHRSEALALRGALAVIDRLPFSVAAAFARGLADVWYLADSRRRRVARANILRSGIETEPRAAARLARRSARHMAMVVVESLKSGSILDGERWREHVEIDIPERVGEILDDPEQGLILVSGHLGNWEIAAQLLSQRKPLAGITRPMNNPLVERIVQQRKPRYSFEPIPKYGADAARFVSVLKQGRILGLLIDQHARAGAMSIDFFGHPAATYTTAPMLHLVTRAPLCFAVSVRTGPMRFRLSVSDLVQGERTGDRRGDVRALLDTLTGQLESAIRRDPDQYLWGHRRWRDDAET